MLSIAEANALEPEIDESKDELKTETLDPNSHVDDFVQTDRLRVGDIIRIPATATGCFEFVELNGNLEPIEPASRGEYDSSFNIYKIISRNVAKWQVSANPRLWNRYMKKSDHTNKPHYVLNHDLDQFTYQQAVSHDYDASKHPQLNDELEPIDPPAADEEGPNYMDVLCSISNSLDRLADIFATFNLAQHNSPKST